MAAFGWAAGSVGAGAHIGSAALDGVVGHELHGAIHKLAALAPLEPGGFEAAAALSVRRGCKDLAVEQEHVEYHVARLLA